MYWQKSRLVIYKMITEFLNTWPADDKDYLLNTEDLAQPIQMQLSQKQQTFSNFFFPF